MSKKFDINIDETKKEVSFIQREDLLWEKYEGKKPTGKLYKEIDIKPPKWVGSDATKEEKEAWSKEAERRLKQADDEDVEMFFELKGGAIPTLTFVKFMRNQGE